MNLPPTVDVSELGGKLKGHIIWAKEVIPSTPVTAITCLSGYDLVEIMLKGLGGDTYTIRAHASAVLTVSRG